MTDFFMKNLEWFSNNISAELASFLMGYKSDLQPIGKLEDGSLNIQNKNTKDLFYINGLLPEIKNEHNNFLKKPTQYFLPPSFNKESQRPNDLPEWDHIGRCVHDHFLQKTAHALEGSLPEQTPHNNGNWLVSFGLGLGAQFLLYLQNPNIKNIVIVEPKIDLIYCSLHGFDWQPIAEEINRRDGQISFIFEQNPIMAAHHALHALRGLDFDLVDGSYATQHYASDFMSDAISTFQANISILEKGLGFLEDEILMYKNCYLNLCHEKWRQLPKQAFAPHKNIPVFVIGSGPSLDDSIEVIKRYQDNTILISSGTALSSLLHHGIIPDFHCETENTNHTVRVLKKLPSELLKQTTLIATSTTPPEIHPLFKTTIFSIREDVSPTRILFEKEEIITTAATNVACLATMAAISLGHKDIYFFGTDFGTRDTKKHHSNTSIYNTEDDPFYKKGFNMMKMNIKIPAQRGGTVLTNTYFKYAMQFLELIIQTYSNQHNFYNTANGAKIQQTKTIKPNQIKLSSPKVTKTEFINNLETKLMHKNGFEILSSPLLKQFETSVRIQHDSLLKLFSPQQQMSYEQLYPILKSQLLKGHNDQAHGLEPAVRCFSSGTFLFILQRLDWLKKRLSNEEMEKIWPDLRAVIFDNLQEMQNKTKKMFAELGEIHKK